MKFAIKEQIKKEVFIAIFGTLKNCSSLVCIHFNESNMHIQGMDKSHICLFETTIMKQWFDIYELDSTNDDKICIDTTFLFNIINSAHECHSINIHFENDLENINIDLIVNQDKNKNKGEFNKYFKLPLANMDYDLVTIPSVEYDAEFTISSKKIVEITSQMLSFGSDINVICTEEKINLITNGINGEMLVNIPIDDLNEYAISEDEIINLTYSLNYIHKMCLTNKISNQIQFYVSNQFPMKIKYDLGLDSSVIFFIAPKISE
jgi:proliferating cell nuclear antigen PCNA